MGAGWTVDVAGAGQTPQTPTRQWGGWRGGGAWEEETGALATQRLRGGRQEPARPGPARPQPSPWPGLGARRHVRAAHWAGCSGIEAALFPRSVLRSSGGPTVGVLPAVLPNPTPAARARHGSPSNGWPGSFVPALCSTGHLTWANHTASPGLSFPVCVKTGRNGSDHQGRWADRLKNTGKVLSPAPDRWSPSGGAERRPGDPGGPGASPQPLPMCHHSLDSFGFTKIKTGPRNGKRRPCCARALGLDSELELEGGRAPLEIYRT